MKTLLLPIFTLLAIFAGAQVQAQTVIAEDYASNYNETTFDALENLGSGFGDWHRALFGDDAIVRLQSAADNGANSVVIDTEGVSFGITSSIGAATDQLAELGRIFAQPLQDGETFSFELAWNWATPGMTGVALFHDGWGSEDQVIVIDFNSGGYYLNGDEVEEHASAEDWNDGFRSEGVALDFAFTQNGDDIDYVVTAITAESHVNFSGTVTGVNVDRVKFYNDERPNWGEAYPGQGSIFVNSLMITSDDPTSAEENTVASRFQLYQNYPNPFNPSTKITFSLDTPQYVTLTVYDLLGREISVLHDGVTSAGVHTVQFNAAGLNSGVYFYRLSTDEVKIIKQMMLLK